MRIRWLGPERVLVGVGLLQFRQVVEVPDAMGRDLVSSGRAAAVGEGEDSESTERPDPGPPQPAGRRAWGTGREE